MKAHEYQAKGFLKKYGITVPNGIVTDDISKVKEIAGQLGGKVVVKAQVLAGGRGKAGGVKLAKTAEEAEQIAKTILGATLHTHQTGPEGVLVKKILIEEAANIEKEFYVGIVLDRAAEKYIFMVSPFGGMEIEEVAKEHPDALFKVFVDYLELFPFQARQLAFNLGLSGDAFKQAIKLFLKLFKLHIELDASLTEINPLILTKEGDIVALDAKINFDDNALYRHKDIAEIRDDSEDDKLEVEAKKYDLNYVKLDGEVGCMVNGAGLAMATMDIIKYYGSMPANFLDVGGGASVETVRNAFKILLEDKSVKVVLINIFGGIVRCDRIANGVIQAAKEIGVDRPMVIRLVGTNQEEGREILKNAPFSFHTFDTMSEAAKKAVELTKGGN
jgi:succinyl-CoA synthetase beta subunit